MAVVCRPPEFAWSPHSAKLSTQALHIQDDTLNIFRRPLLLALLLVAAAQAGAADLYITAAGMVDTASGRYVESPALIVSGNRIVDVGRQGELAVPGSAEVVDLGDATLLPGFMDMHVHLSSANKNISFLEAKLQSVPRLTVNAVRNARLTLMAGFTSVRDLGSTGTSVIAVRDGIDAGDIIGPRIWASGPALGITGGHCDNNFFPPELKVRSEGVADGPWQARTRVREVIKLGANAIKFCATGGVFSRGTTVGAQQYSLEEMTAIVDESHRRGMVVAAHAHGTQGIKAAIEAGVDSVEHASILDAEAIRMAKKRGTVLSMDIYNTDYTQSVGKANGVPEENLRKDREVAEVQRESFRSAVKAGVKMVFGSDAAIFPHGRNAGQFAVMVQYGMTEMQALQAATVNAATLMKREDLGVLKPGALADIVAVPANPLDDIRSTESVNFIMKDGVIYLAP